MITPDKTTLEQMYVTAGGGVTATSDYLMVIVPVNVKVKPTDALLIHSFTPPSSPITFNPDTSLYGHLTPSMSTQAVRVTYYQPRFKAHIIDKLWRDEYVGGVPRFVPKSSLPNIFIFKVNNWECIFSGRACRISYPQPTIDPTKVEASLMQTTITCNDYTINI